MAWIENFKRKVQIKILENLFRSLFYYREELEDYGDQIFEALFYNRDETRDQIFTSFIRLNNAIIIGNPGEGKSTLMHYMFLKTGQEKNLHPVIIDENEIFPKTDDFSFVVINFIRKLLAYFEIIGHPCAQINGKITSENYNDCYEVAVDHFFNVIPLEEIKRTKRLIIFLDDFDYMETKAVNILKRYFVPFFQASPNVKARCSVILSGRKLLLDTLIKDDRELRVKIRSRPREIHLNRLSVKKFAERRLNGLFGSDIRDKYPKGYKAFVSFMTLKMIRLFNVTRFSPKTIGNKKIAEGVIHTTVSENINFLFDTVFYTNLAAVTGRNLRDIEAMLPLMYLYQLKQETSDFNTDFCSSYLSFCIQNNQKNERYWMLDLLNPRVTTGKKKNFGNAILQVVLEYFQYNQVADDAFYLKMAEFGIDPKTAKRALVTLIKTPYTLLDPKALYQDSSNELIVKEYNLNRKGRFYLDFLVNHPIYCKHFGGGSTRSLIKEEYETAA